MDQPDSDPQKPLVNRPSFNRRDSMTAISQGLPEFTDAEKDANEAKAKRVVGGIMGVTLGLAFALGLAVHYLIPNPAYDMKLALIKEYELQYVYLGAVIFVRTVMFINTYPMIFKARIMKGNSGNLRANMYIYKVAGPSSEPPKTVVLEDFGDVGMYNRANRSLTHMIENVPGVVVSFLLSGFMYPRVVLALCAVFAAGRVMHAVGYSKRGYGAHGAGFGVATLAATLAEGLVLVTAFKGFGAF